MWSGIYNMETGISVGGHIINTIRYANDKAVVANSQKGLQLRDNMSTVTTVHLFGQDLLTHTSHTHIWLTSNFIKPCTSFLEHCMQSCTRYTSTFLQHGATHVKRVLHLARNVKTILAPYKATNHEWGLLA